MDVSPTNKKSKNILNRISFEASVIRKSISIGSDSNKDSVLESNNTSEKFADGTSTRSSDSKTYKSDGSSSVKFIEPKERKILKSIISQPTTNSAENAFRKLSKNYVMLANENPNITTTEIEMEDKVVTNVEEQKRFVEVPVPCKPPKALNLSVSSIDSEEIITVPGIENKKITTVKKIMPKRIQTVAVKALKPVVIVTHDKNKEITEIKTPLKRHITTKTTVQKLTTTTTETTILIGKAAEADNMKTVEKTDS